MNPLPEEPSSSVGGLTATPTLTVVSGPPGAGKTTLARELARMLGCPAILRDEIKQGLGRVRKVRVAIAGGRRW
ncbi:AAA family ATPase [Streptomyces sp. NPDC049555]|uniref:AAA family ATPase n=1 Tax=Streptomyces sp. NPDC049555 TaxID=3154930 RepID=UPI003429E50A